MRLDIANAPEHLDKNEAISIVYDKFRQPLFNERLPVHIFGTGSEGNSIYLKPQSTLIDLGFGMKKYTDYDPHFFLKIDFIIITHHHGDHLNPSTLLNVMKNYPNVRVIMHPSMWEYLMSGLYKAQYLRLLSDTGEQLYHQNDQGLPIKSKPMYAVDPETGQQILDPSKKQWSEKLAKYEHRIIPTEPMQLKTHDNHSFLFVPRTTKHGDIINIAIQLYDEKYNLTLLYASDLDNLHGQTTFIDYAGNEQTVDGLIQDQTQYNCIFLEANYDEEVLATWLENKIAEVEASDKPQYIKEKEIRNIEARGSGNKRHISEQETFPYIQKHLTDEGLFIPLHASRTFGTLIQK